MDMFDPGNIFFWRSVERLIALLIGAGSIYLGYRLFASMREFTADGEGKVELPGGVSIYVSRVGPGVFFALFGAAIVAFGILSPAQTQTKAQTQAQVEAQADTAFSGQEITASYVGDKANNKNSSAVFDGERARTLRDLDALKQLETTLSAAAENGDLSLSAADSNRLRIAIPHIRQMLMMSVWDEQNWGDLNAFRDWVHNGDPASPPAGLTAASRKYLNVDN